MDWAEFLKDVDEAAPEATVVTTLTTLLQANNMQTPDESARLSEEDVQSLAGYDKLPAVQRGFLQRAVMTAGVVFRSKKQNRSLNKAALHSARDEGGGTQPVTQTKTKQSKTTSVTPPPAPPQILKARIDS